MNGDWFYAKAYAVFGGIGKDTRSSLAENHTRWIIILSKGFTRADIENVSRSVRAYVYLVLSSQV